MFSSHIYAQEGGGDEGGLRDGQGSHERCSPLPALRQITHHVSDLDPAFTGKGEEQ